VSGGNRQVLRERAEKMVRALAGIDLPMYEESLAHHTELFKSLPGMLGTWDRWMQVTNVEAADLLPKSTYSLGDPSPSLVAELVGSGEPFGLTLRSPDRVNDNFLVLGGSGAGKSVFLNMLLAYEVLYGPKAGRLLAIDYASPEKSSLLVASQVFGGDYVPIRTDGRRINPFPAPRDACEADGKTVKPLVLAFLVDLGNILFRNTDGGKSAGLYAALLQRAVRKLYEQWETSESPVFSDFYEALEALIPSDDDEAARLRDLTKLVESTVLHGPEAKLFNGPTTAKTDGDFLVYDLHGLEKLDDRVKAGVVFVATNLVRELAFDGRPERRKTIIFEEATALMKLGMKGLIEELLTTARAHGTSVGVINQVYEKFRESGLADTITVNTPVWAFLSHGSAMGAIAPIIHDFGLTERQAEVFRSVRAVKRRFSEVMLVMQTATPRGVEETTSKARLRLSPFDYWLVTSDAKDRALQRRLQAAEPELSQLDIVEVLARRAS
jgi:type IV secretory pathway VirB4 component